MSRTSVIWVPSPPVAASVSQLQLRAFRSNAKIVPAKNGISQLASRAPQPPKILEKKLEFETAAQADDASLSDVCSARIDAIVAAFSKRYDAYGERS